jgi:acetamidase/formamidase
MPRTHYLPDTQAHYKWDARNQPALMIDSGDTVVLWTRDISDNQVAPGSGAAVLENFDWSRAYPLNGPIGVGGAEPGDVLQIDVLDVQTQGWGWTGILPGFGLLTEEFPTAYLRVFDLSDGAAAHLADNVRIPLAPYFGTMGVCPAGAVEQPVVRPGTFGGNMDIRQLVSGSSLYLRVEVPDALFSCGDAHGAQADGEVCGTGIEAPMYAALRFSLTKGRSIPGPQFRSPGPLTPRVDGAPFFGTTGVGGDLFRASKDAVRAMIAHISSHYGLTAEDAYVLCSLAVDLKVSEIVDGGQYIVSALLPEAIFC